ncbi:MAG: potassium transporter Kup [Pseudomonadota bacterium]|nr:potassium transporter Kup [Pseudomonadota bacterium]
MTNQKTKSGVAALTVAAIGIVYGDIGTSPLYALNEVFSKQNGNVELTPTNIVGVVSLIIWGLTVIVSLKYVSLILRADNRGEGGIMALLALALVAITDHPKWLMPLTVIGVAGASLFFGDGVITPAISVLSAVEGLEVAAPALKAYVVPITVAILIALYLVQHKGSSGLGRLFGPIMLLWFLGLAVMGIINIAATPSILAALSPFYALGFLLQHGWLSFIALGAIVLAFTGAEALYADMGHFGRRPIRLAWFFIVFPALALNYLGQGAILLTHPEAVGNLFFHQLGSWSIYPLVVISTIATVIASQATISGTFSITNEAISLGFFPRMKVIHTSSREVGQIYVPLVNWIQLGAVLMAVIGFGSSTNLGAAYGIAVTGCMVITTILTFFVLHFGWKYNIWLASLATFFFLAIDLVLFSANTLKITRGGWFPLVLGALVFTVMLTWKRGLELVTQKLTQNAIPLKEFLASLLEFPPVRVEGVAVFIRRITEGVPHAMLHNLAHNKVLHTKNVFLTVHQRPVPRVPDAQRLTVQELEHDCYQIDVNYGFKDEPDVPEALSRCPVEGLQFDTMETSYFVSRQTIIPSAASAMALWREQLFVMMYRNARDTAYYFRLPTNRVIELGNQIEI